MPYAGPPHALHDILRQEIDEASTLLSILEDEFAALTRRHLEGIENATAAKRDHINALDTLARAQIASLQEAGYAVDSDGLQCYIAHHDQHGRTGLRATWQKLTKLLSQCREQNNINGRLVMLGRQHGQNMLAILRGEDPSGPACYNAPGASSLTPSSKRMLAKA